MDFDTAVKLNIYETIARTKRAPTSVNVAKALSTSAEEYGMHLGQSSPKEVMANMANWL